MGVRLRLGGREEAVAISMQSNPAGIGVEELLAEIQEAHRDWVNAQYHFEHATGDDHIDYAVFAIEAAQKRYEMLLRQAKRLGAVSPAWKGGVPG